jgi:hypothetical protein
MITYTNSIMNIDTNIDNYNLEDMFRLFQVSDNLPNEHLVQINTMMYTLTTSDTNLESDMLDQNVIVLFKKISTILSCLHKYRDYLKIKNADYKYKKSDDNNLVYAIKQIPNYENANDANYLVNKIIEKTESVAEKQKEKNKAEAEITPHPVVFDKMVNQIVNTFENKLVAGNINSIKRITKFINVHLDSCFRDKYYNSNPCNYTYQLPKQFKNVVSMKLASIEIPNAWYLFSHLKKNNTFNVEVTACKKCGVYTIVIPDGNYNSDSLVSFLNMKYFHQSTTDSPLKHISISVNEFTNKTQFELLEKAPDDMIFSLHFANEDTDNILETCGWMLGFRVARYLGIEDMILSEGLFDAGGDRYIYLSVNDYQYNYNETNIICFDKASMEDYTLAKIPLLNGKFSLIIDENDKNPLVKIRQYNGPVNLSKLEIKILDKYGNVVNLNFMDFSFSLELEVLYERNSII